MWLTMFKQDTEEKGVGTVVAILDSVSYSRRVNTADEKDIDAFVAEAKEKATGESETKTETEAVEAVIASRLNKE